MKNLGFVVFSVILFSALLSCGTSSANRAPLSGEVITLFNRGNEYLRTGDYERAIAHYTAVLTLRPDLTMALHNRALAHLGRGDYDRALDDFAAILVIEPNNNRATEGLAFVLDLRSRQAVPAPAPDQPGTLFFTGAGGRGMTLAILEPVPRGLTEDQLRWMPALVQGSMTGDFNLYSAMTVTDRQNLETILAEQELSMTGLFSDEDFIRIGHLVNARYVLVGSITRTATVYMLEFAVTNVETNVRKASRRPTPVSLLDIEDLSAVREATADLLEQLGVNLTALGRRELTRPLEMAAVQAQTALAWGITAQRQGLEAEAMSHFLQAGSRDPGLGEAKSRLDVLAAGLARPASGEAAWHRQWTERLRETENFFANYTRRQTYFLVYDSDSIREGPGNHTNQTVELSLWMSLVPDPVWADTINRVVSTVADGLAATGRAGDWNLDWPRTPLSAASPFNDRAETLAVAVEIVNARGVSIGRQTVAVPAGFNVHPTANRNVVPKQWEGNVVFPSVNVNQITDRLDIRVTGVNDAPAAYITRQTGVTVMSNAELFRTAGIRRAPADTSNFVRVQGGTFQMGCETCCWNASPVRSVTVSTFYMSRFQVTQGEWYDVMGTRPGRFTGATDWDGNPVTGVNWRNLPVEQVSWYDTIVFSNRLSIQRGLTPAYSIGGSTNPDNWGPVPTSSNATWNAVAVVPGSTGYRLPTEAQWECVDKARKTAIMTTQCSASTFGMIS